MPPCLLAGCPPGLSLWPVQSIAQPAQLPTVRVVLQITTNIWTHVFMGHYICHSFDAVFVEITPSVDSPTMYP